jgi:malate dehydrogenase (oxaloacetate-decarboxylating)
MPVAMAYSHFRPPPTAIKHSVWSNHVSGYVVPVDDEGLNYRRRYQGLIGVNSKVPIRDTEMLSLVYTPGVAEACLEIERDPLLSFDYTCRGNTVAILTDGSDLFGSQGTPPEAALPVAEAKSVVFKTFAGIDAFPICLGTNDPMRIIETGLAISPTFGAICIDDIAAPHAFTIADHLEKAANIPVFSNQHHGTAVLILGGLLNALKVSGKKLDEISVVISGAGIAGVGVSRLLVRAGVKRLVVCDRAGAIYKYRPERMNWAKSYIAKETNFENRRGSLRAMMRGADVFIGLSTGNIVTEEMIASMAENPIVFAMAIPDPEIDPVLAKAAGARVVATGRPDYPNTLDISLVFPGVFRGLLDARARNIRLRTLIYAAEALADLVKPDELHADYIIPRVFDFQVAPAIAAAVVRAANEAGEAGVTVDPESVAKKTRSLVYEHRRASVSTSLLGTTLKERAIELRKRNGGVLEVRSNIPIRDQHMLNVLCMPPSALIPAQVIRDDPTQVNELTAKGNLVAIVTDGTAVLGLGNIGPQAGLPVMEGKAVLFQSLAGVEAFPICIAETDVDEIVKIVEAISPSFGGINLEDISAPRCFEIEAKLRERLDMPVFHDDQHGTAIVVLAALINAARLRGNKLSELNIVMNGAGAAGIAVARLLIAIGIGDIIICDRAGAIHEERGVMDESKLEIARISNKDKRSGSLADVMAGADVFIGVSAAGVVSPEMVKSMAPRPIVLALANPTPEITPTEAYGAGALVVCTGRSDFPNQVNNSLAFPGCFRGALDVRARGFNDEMKLAAAKAIAELVADDKLSPHNVIPGALDLRVPPRVAAAVARAAIETGIARVIIEPEAVESRCRELVYSGAGGI